MGPSSAVGTPGGLGRDGSRRLQAQRPQPRSWAPALVPPSEGLFPVVALSPRMAGCHSQL